MKGPLVDIVRAIMHGTDFHAFYRAKVVAQNADGTLELSPDNQTLGGLSRVAIRHGVPGIAVHVAAGAVVLVGFENGDPHRPIAALFEPQGLTQLQLGVGATDGVALDSKVQAQLTALKNAIQGWVVAPNDGGAALKAALTTLFATWPASVGSALVKAKDNP